MRARDLASDRPAHRPQALGRQRTINTGDVERGGCLFGPWDLEVRTCRGIDDAPGGDVGVEIARHIHMRDTFR